MLKLKGILMTQPEQDISTINIIQKLPSLALLTILWLVCSIPLITIGASTTALYYVTLKLSKNEEVSISQSFFNSFRSNLKQSTIILFILSLLGVICYYIIDNFFGIKTTFNTIVSIAVAAFTGILIVISIYIFPVLSKFDNTIPKTFLNAIFIAIRFFKKTLIVVGIELILAFFVFQFRPVGLLFMLLFAMIAFVQSFTFNDIFDKLIEMREQALNAVEEFELEIDYIETNENESGEEL